MQQKILLDTQESEPKGTQINNGKLKSSNLNSDPINAESNNQITKKKKIPAAPQNKKSSNNSVNAT